jgi:hypothetical protein
VAREQATRLNIIDASKEYQREKVATNQLNANSLIVYVEGSLEVNFFSNVLKKTTSDGKRIAVTMTAESNNKSRVIEEVEKHPEILGIVDMDYDFKGKYTSNERICDTRPRSWTSGIIMSSMDSEQQLRIIEKIVKIIMKPKGGQTIMQAGKSLEKALVDSKPYTKSPVETIAGSTKLFSQIRVIAGKEGAMIKQGIQVKNHIIRKNIPPKWGQYYVHEEVEELDDLEDKILQYGLRPDITEISICDHDIKDCISAFLKKKGFDVNNKSKKIIEDTLCDAFDRKKGLPRDMKEFFKKWGLI